jgi:hypothetical protein
MKNIKYLFSIALCLAAFASSAQTFNWGSLKKEQKHILNMNVNSEYGITYGIGYSYHLSFKLPIILNSEYSFPSGKNITDDFKTKIGGQVDLFQAGNFHFIAKLQGIFRRYENDYARLLNFGSDLSGTVGYYKKKWFVAGDIGFDKAIVTHFRHSGLYKSNYPDVKDGWYEPSTGGNLYYGIQGGLSGKKFDVYLKAGKLTEQDFKTSPMLPLYAQLGLNIKLR